MFAYCGNNPIENYDPAGSYYVSAEDRITTDCCGRGGILVVPTRPNNPNTNTESCSIVEELVYYIGNTDEQVVLNAEYVALYKGVFVLKVPGQSAGFSLGIMFISSNVSSVETVKHEYGHTKQLDSLGLPTYLSTVAVPSVICFALQENNPLLQKYYFSLPWERKADELGGATDNYIPGSGIVSDIYWGSSKIISKVFGY